MRAWLSSAIALGIDEVLFVRPTADPTSIFAVKIMDILEVSDGKDEITVKVAEFMR